MAEVFFGTYTVLWNLFRVLKFWVYQEKIFWYFFPDIEVLNHKDLLTQVLMSF